MSHSMIVKGTLYGQAVADCNGDCNGTALVGDLDFNGAQEYTDAVAYVEGILGVISLPLMY